MRKSLVLSAALAFVGAVSPVAAQSPIGSACSAAINAQIYFGGSGISTANSFCGTNSNGNIIALSVTPRYSSPDVTTSGNGIFYAAGGESVGGTKNAGFSTWNFDYFVGNAAGYTNTNLYTVFVDRDPSAAVDYVTWAQFTGNGHDSSNEGYLRPGFDPFAGGTYSIKLQERDVTGALVDEVAVNVAVNGVTATPEPASLALMATGLVGVGGFVRRRKRLSAAA